MNTTAGQSANFSKNDPPSVLKDYIWKSPFLTGLRDEHRQTLLDCAMIQTFAEGEEIFREGDPANRFYLIIQGEVALESEDDTDVPEVIQRIGADDVLGWSWLFPPFYWHFTARATKPTKAVFFYGTRLRDICDENTELGYDLMKRITSVVIQRLQATRKDLLKRLKKQR